MDDPGSLPPDLLARYKAACDKLVPKLAMLHSLFGDIAAGKADWQLAYTVQCIECEVERVLRRGEQMPYTEEDERKMGEIADATARGAMTELAGLLSNEGFRAKLLDHDNVESDRDFECLLKDAISCFDYLLDVAKSRQARLCSARSEKAESND